MRTMDLPVSEFKNACGYDLLKDWAPNGMLSDALIVTLRLRKIRRVQS